MFLLEVEIISTGVNVTFDDKVKEQRCDPDNAPVELGINKNWKPQNQITIDQRKKQLEQRLLPTKECIYGYNKPERILYECI